MSEQLPREEETIAAVTERDGADAVAARVDRVAKRTSERPDPPKTALGRFLSNTNVKLDHTLEDVCTPQHPGSDVVDG